MAIVLGTFESLSWLFNITNLCSEGKEVTERWAECLNVPEGSLTVPISNSPAESIYWFNWKPKKMMGEKKLRGWESIMCPSEIRKWESIL